MSDSEDKTYENEVNHRGPLDLTRQIENLKLEKIRAVEEAKKEADGLMIKKMIELNEVKEDNKKLVQQVEDQRKISRGHQRQNGELHIELKESKKKECKCNTKTSTSS